MIWTGVPEVETPCSPSAGASAPGGAPALMVFTATNQPTTTTEHRPVVGDTPSLTLRRQK
jgi:hypothetical protein